MKNELEKPRSSDVRVELSPEPSEGRAERMAVLRKGLAPGPKEREEAVFQAMFKKMAEASLFPRRGAQIQVTVEEPIDKAAWLDKEMGDIQTELGSPVLRKGLAASLRLHRVDFRQKIAGSPKGTTRWRISLPIW